MADLSNSIVKISFLDRDRNGELVRRKVSASRGKFPVNTNGTGRKHLTAMEFVKLILDRDPVLYLDNQRRMKVCQGDSSQMRVAMMCLIEAHDAKHVRRLPDW